MKRDTVAYAAALIKVAPLAGAWIETRIIHTRVVVCVGRAPRGRVD